MDGLPGVLMYMAPYGANNSRQEHQEYTVDSTFAYLFPSDLTVKLDLLLKDSRSDPSGG